MTNKRLALLGAFFVALMILAGCSGGGGSSPPSGPERPQGLLATPASASSITLTWSGSPAFTGYRIYRNDVEVGQSTGTSFTDAGLTAGVVYRYFVRADTNSGLSPASDSVTATAEQALRMALAQLIDPTSRSYLMARDVAFDSSGNIYVAGGAFSASFPTTAGAYDRTFAQGGSSTGSAGASDAFVMKFNRSGALLWSTLVGGPNHDRAYALALAPDGGVVIAGRAGEGFPTTANVIQPAFAGDNDANSNYGRQDGFVAKISADGARLLWSTYVGDPSFGFVRDLAVDAQNKIYLAAIMTPGLAHITRNAAQATARGAHDLAYLRLNATASALEYGTYLGGSDIAGPLPGTPSIALSPARDVHLVIQESGSGAPTTSNAFQRNNAGGVDLLVAKFNSSDRLVYATYLGGSGDESLETHNIAVDAAGRAIVAAQTRSSNYPVVNGAYQAFSGGASDVGVTIMSSDGTSLVASTLLGGALDEETEGVKVKTDGTIMVSLSTRSSSLRCSSGAVQRNFAGEKDGYFIALAGDLRSANYLTFLGGSGEEQARSIAIAPDGWVVAIGHTASSNFPVSAGGSTAPNGGAHTGWLAILRP